MSTREEMQACLDKIKGFIAEGEARGIIGTSSFLYDAQRSMEEAIAKAYPPALSHRLRAIAGDALIRDTARALIREAADELDKLNKQAGATVRRPISELEPHRFAILWAKDKQLGAWRCTIGRLLMRGVHQVEGPAMLNPTHFTELPADE